MLSAVSEIRFILDVFVGNSPDHNRHHTEDDDDDDDDNAEHDGLTIMQKKASTA